MLLLLLLFLGLITRPAQAYSSSWSHYITLTIENSQVDGTLTDFPPYLNLSDIDNGSSFWSTVKSDCGDIRFTLSDQATEIPREIVECDTSNKEGEIYFKVAGTLSATSNSDIYMFYGNPGASDYAVSDTYGAENTWTAYDAVYHFQDSDLLDSTSNSNDASASGFTASSAMTDTQWGNGITMGGSGSGDAINISSSNLSSAGFRQSDMQVSGIVKNDATGTGPGYYLDIQTPRTVIHEISSSSGSMRLYISSGVDTSGGYIASSTFTHFAAMNDNSAGGAEIYISGINRASGTRSASSSSLSGAIAIGARYASGTTNPLNGVIAEYRFAQHLNGEWASTEYNNLMDSSNFYSIGAQTVNPGDPAAEGSTFFGGFGSFF